MLVCREDLGTGAGAGLLDGRYELQNELGRGATGVVWEAVDRVSSEIVAVKILHRHLLSSVRARKRFVREARSAGVLKDPHSVAVKGHGCGPDGDAYLVMERLLGVTLATLLKNNSDFPQLRAIRIVAQVLEAVSAAHRVSILHRDLKPNNVMLIEHDGDPDFVKVCDFGLDDARFGRCVRAGAEKDATGAWPLVGVGSTGAQLAPRWRVLRQMRGHAR